MVVSSFSPLPYAASAARCRARIAASLGLAPEPQLLKKELTRCIIPLNGMPLTLSVPVEGGNRTLRNLYGAHAASSGSLDNLRLSEHDNWRHRHIAAFEAAYHATPFFLHYAPPLIEAISSAETLGELLRGTAIPLQRVCSPEIIAEMSALREVSPLLCESLCSERSTNVCYNYSVLDVIFHLGPETIFALWPTLL